MLFRNLSPAAAVNEDGNGTLTRRNANKKPIQDSIWNYDYDAGSENRTANEQAGEDNESILTDMISPSGLSLIHI